MKTAVESIDSQFNHVTWTVYLTASNLDEFDSWVDDVPLFKYEMSFAYLSQALEYARSWTTEAAQALMREANRTCLQVNIDKDFHTSVKDNYDGCRPCVAGISFVTYGEAIERNEYYDSSGVACTNPH